MLFGFVVSLGSLRGGPFEVMVAKPDGQEEPERSDLQYGSAGTVAEWFQDDHWQLIVTPAIFANVPDFLGFTPYLLEFVATTDEQSDGQEQSQT